MVIIDLMYKSFVLILLTRRYKVLCQCNNILCEYISDNVLKQFEGVNETATSYIKEFPYRSTCTNIVNYNI